MLYKIIEAIFMDSIVAFQTVVRVTVAKSCTFSFTDESADILFDSKLDGLNFSELTEETVFGQRQNTEKACLEVWDADEQAVSNHYFSNKNNQIVLNKPVMPAMLTLDEKNGTDLVVIWKYCSYKCIT